MRFFIAVITMCLAAALNPALARQHPANSYMQPFAIEASILGNVEKPRRTSLRAHKKGRSYVHGSAVRDGRPAKWCGWWMRTQYGGGPEYNLARNWAKRGSNAGGPQVGAVIVWPHHVGIITGRASNGQWIVKSGNDGGAVRERVRSVAGAIAFRVL